jgi:rhodanese-related sulfurtransferase
MKISSADYTIINSTEKLREIIENSSGHQVFIDLRETRDYEQSHITGAISIPYDEMDTAAFENDLAKQHLHAKDVYLYCYSGNKSAMAFNLLLRKGYSHVHAITIGYEEYIASEGDLFSEGEAICEPCREKEENER